MKHKKIVFIFLIILICILIGGFFLVRFLNNKEEETMVEEYTPQEEITDKQVRQTIVSLYFLSTENGELNPEARLIDIKEIINNPYEKLVNLLIEGPKNDKNKKIIPDNTKLIKNYLENDCVVLDFSSDILNYSKENKTNKDIMINSIVNTLTELNEVNKVKILVEGQASEQYNETYQRSV